MAEIKPGTKTEIAPTTLRSLTFGVLLRPSAPVESTAIKASEEKGSLAGASSSDATKEATSSSKPPATEKAAEPARQAPAPKRPADVSEGREPTGTKYGLARSEHEIAIKTTTTSNPPVVMKADEPVGQSPVKNRRPDFIGWGDSKLPGAVTSPEEKAVQHHEGERKQAAKETLEIVARGFVVGKVLGEAPSDTLPGVTVAMLRIQTLEPTPREFLISKGGAKRVEVFDDGVEKMKYRWADPVNGEELKALHDSVRGEGKIVVVRGTAIERFKESDGRNRPEWSIPSCFPEDAQAEIKKVVDGAEKK